MNKKSQITVFIVIGVLLVMASIAVIYITQYYLPKKALPLPNQETEPIKLYIESCAKGIAEDGLYIMGRKGGYITNTPPLNINFYDFNLSYFYYKGSIKMPQKTEMEKQLSDYMDANIPLCDLSQFEKTGLTIKKGNATTKVNFAEQSTFITINYPLTISKGRLSASITNLSVELPVKFGKLYTSLGLLTSKQALRENQKSILLSDIKNIGAANNYYFNLQGKGNDTIVFIVIDNSSRLYNEPYEFRYAYAYPTEEIPLPANRTTLKLNPIRDQILEQGTRYTKQMTANGTNYTFFDTTSMFDISADGLINFTPQQKDVGTNVVLIGVKDIYGNTDYRITKFTVLDVNDPPILNLTNFTIVKNTNFLYNISAYDPDGDNLTYTLVNAPADALFNATIGQINWTPSTIGVYTFGIRVTDIAGLPALGSFDVNVTE